MAKTPKNLEKYKKADGGLGPEAEDNNLVKLRTLKTFGAFLIGLIPNAGGGIALRRSPDGDVWTQTAEAKAFQINSQGKVWPGMVGGVMPTIDGDPLNATDKVLDLTQDGDFVYFKLNFTPVWVEDYLASGWTLDSVSVEQNASLPSEDADTKYIQFNSISNGAPYGPSYFNQSINIRLLDNGTLATRLEYNP